MSRSQSFSSVNPLKTESLGVTKSEKVPKNRQKKKKPFIFTPGLNSYQPPTLSKSALVELRSPKKSMGVGTLNRVILGGEGDEKKPPPKISLSTGLIWTGARSKVPG